MSFWSRRWYLAVLLAFVPVVTGVLLWSTVDARRDPSLQLAVSLSARTLKVIEDGEVVRTYGIAVGSRKYPTPTGSFRTGRVEWNPSWTPPPREWARNKKPREAGDPANPMQGVKIYFKAPWYFIHGTNNPGSIGEAASHGCIRMRTKDAVSLARRVQKAGGGVPLVIRP